MKYLHWGLGLLASFAAVPAILITAFQIGAYGDFSFYEKEYVKYQVTEELDMKLEDVMDVTHQMMDYLIGEKEELSVITDVDGREQDFFNEQDRLHMLDVKHLFLGGLKLRTACLAAAAVCIAGLLAGKADLKKILPKAWFCALAVCGVLFVVIAAAAFRDFTRVFTIFHEIFSPTICGCSIRQRIT